MNLQYSQWKCEEGKHKYEGTSSKDCQLSLWNRLSTCQISLSHELSYSLMIYRHHSTVWYTCLLIVCTIPCKNNLLVGRTFHFSCFLLVFAPAQFSSSYYNLGLCFSLVKEQGLTEWIFAFIFLMRWVLWGNILDIVGACTWESQKGVYFPCT